MPRPPHRWQWHGEIGKSTRGRHSRTAAAVSQPPGGEGGEKRRAHFGRCVYSSGLFIPQVVLCAALKAPDDFTALFCQVTSAAASKPTRRPRVKAARFTHTTVCAPEWVYYYAEAVAANIKELWWDTPSSVTRNLDLMIFFKCFKKMCLGLFQAPYLLTHRALLLWSTYIIFYLKVKSKKQDKNAFRNDAKNGKF